MIINVTKTDILYGEPANSTGCAIARSLKRTLGLKKFFAVLPDSVLINGQEIVLPNKAQDFINTFDKHKCLSKPFSFELDYVAKKKTKKSTVKKYNGARLVTEKVLIYA